MGKLKTKWFILCGSICRDDNGKQLKTLHKWIEGRPYDHIYCTQCGWETLLTIPGESAGTRHEYLKRNFDSYYE